MYIYKYLYLHMYIHTHEIFHTYKSIYESFLRPARALCIAFLHYTCMIQQFFDPLFDRNSARV